MKLRVHRGTREIGGTCIELESAGSRIYSILVCRWIPRIWNLRRFRVFRACQSPMRAFSPLSFLMAIATIGDLSQRCVRKFLS